mmetsp:Transcript_68395/g.198265  ORF Transcript_68395/g.198265 Transcript_68395/m.198265 type:complete len:307 (-) Transcript_68395:117-1037(-)
MGHRALGLDMSTDFVSWWMLAHQRSPFALRCACTARKAFDNFGWDLGFLSELDACFTALSARNRLNARVFSSCLSSFMSSMTALRSAVKRQSSSTSCPMLPTGSSPTPTSSIVFCWSRCNKASSLMLGSKCTTRSVTNASSDSTEAPGCTMSSAPRWAFNFFKHSSETFAKPRWHCHFNKGIFSPSMAHMQPIFRDFVVRCATIARRGRVARVGTTHTCFGSVTTTHGNRRKSSSMTKSTQSAIFLTGQPKNAYCSDRKQKNPLASPCPFLIKTSWPAGTKFDTQAMSMMAAFSCSCASKSKACSV